jgi:hypothetical protein
VQALRFVLAEKQELTHMLYAVLCYHSEDVVTSWPADQERAVMGKLAAVEDRLAKAGRLGPVARFMPTTAATTLRKDQDPPLVIDGPFAETKEQLLGFFIIDCVDLTDAIATAGQLARANPGGAYELRPVATLKSNRRFDESAAIE